MPPIIDATVLIPCYNENKHLHGLIKNIEECLKINTFNVLIIDDGSTDGSVKYLKSLQNPNIIILYNQENRGVTYTLNRAIDCINTKYIARLDADDYMYPRRLAIQSQIMDKYTEVVLCGSWVMSFNDVSEECTKYPIEYNHIKAELLFRCAINSSVMMRTKVLKNNNIYYNYPVAEDYELWTRLQDYGKIINIPEVLIKRRIHKEQATQTKPVELLQSTCKIYTKQLQKIAITPTEAELKIHYEVTRQASEKITIHYLEKVNTWLTKIHEANKKHLAYPEPELTTYLKEIWLKNMAGHTKMGISFFNLFSKAILSEYNTYTFWQKCKFFLKCWLKI